MYMQLGLFPVVMSITSSQDTILYPFSTLFLYFFIPLSWILGFSLSWQEFEVP